MLAFVISVATFPYTLKSEQDGSFSFPGASQAALEARLKLERIA